MNELTEKEKIYMAGFFDGEGCIYISKGTRKESVSLNHALRVVISQCDSGFLEHWRQKAGGIGRIYSHEYDDPNKRTGYDWVISSRDGIDFLKEIYHHLVLKKDQADIAINFQKTYDAVTTGHGYTTPKHLIRQREEYRKLLKKLKKRTLEQSNGAKEKIEQIDALNTQHQLSLF